MEDIKYRDLKYKISKKPHNLRLKMNGLRRRKKAC